MIFLLEDAIGSNIYLILETSWLYRPKPSNGRHAKIIAKGHIICSDRVDLKDRFDDSSHELSPFLITIILTTANADMLYNDARPKTKLFSFNEHYFLEKS